MSCARPRRHLGRFHLEQPRANPAHGCAAVPLGAKLSFGAAVIVSARIRIVQISPHCCLRIRSSVGFQLSDALWNGERIVRADPSLVEPTNESMKALVTLIEKYAPDETWIAVFARNGDEVESLFLTGKTHLLDITNPQMCSASPTYTAHIMALARKLSGNPEYIFFDTGEGALIALQQNAFQYLTAGASYQVIDRVGDIVVYKKAILS